MPDALPIGEFLAELDRLVAAAHEPDRIATAVRAGTASPPIARRAALEAYHLARWTTPERALLVANAPDVYAFTMGDSAHYQHWARELARRTGYLGDARYRITLQLCGAVGLDVETVRAHQPMPETIAAAFTLLYYARRSYEEGLSVVAYGWERCSGGQPHEQAVVAGLRAHYAARADADAPSEEAPAALELLRALPLTRVAQDRCREAVRNVVLVLATRVRAMNGWLAA